MWKYTYNYIVIMCIFSDTTIKIQQNKPWNLLKTVIIYDKLNTTYYITTNATETTLPWSHMQLLHMCA